MHKKNCHEQPANREITTPITSSEGSIDDEATGQPVTNIPPKVEESMLSIDTISSLNHGLPQERVQNSENDYSFTDTMDIHAIQSNEQNFPDKISGWSEFLKVCFMIFKLYKNQINRNMTGT